MISIKKFIRQKKIPIKSTYIYIYIYEQRENKKIKQN